MMRFFPGTLLALMSIAVTACGAGQLLGPALTPPPTVTQSPTSTPVLTPTSPPTPTPTPVVMDDAPRIPTTLLTNAVAVPVQFEQPIVLLSKQFSVTVTGTRNVSISPTGAAFGLPATLQESHTLLQLEISVEKLADEPLAFGSARTEWSLVSQWEDGTLHVPAGWCQSSEQNCAPVSSITLIDRRPIDLFVLFVVPNGTKIIHLYLLGAVHLPQM